MKKKFYGKLISFILSVLFISKAFSQNVPLFKDSDKVCFIGNSITYRGDFHHNIALYYTLHFPNKKVSFYNCGINGDRTDVTIARLQKDVLIFNPTWAVIMLGMNDIRRSLYMHLGSSTSDTLLLRQKELNIYKRNLDSIVRFLLNRHIKVVLQTSSIYDQTSVSPAFNNTGSDDGLKICSEIDKEIAHKYNLILIDNRTILSGINVTLQKKDSGASVIGADRIHPGSLGNFIMSYQFLKTTGSYGVVSKIFIDKSTRLSQSESKNCIIKNVKIEDATISFTCKEYSFPFPVRDDQISALSFVPFNTDCNEELLQIPECKKGTYKLSIDKSVVGLFSGDTLKNGLNLSNITKTPQFKQALKIKGCYDSLWNREAVYRSLQQIKFYDLGKVNLEDSEAVRKTITGLDGKTQRPQFKKSLSSIYYELKPKEEEMRKNMDSIRNEIYELSLPEDHFFSIEQISK